MSALAFWIVGFTYFICGLLYIVRNCQPCDPQQWRGCSATTGYDWFFGISGPVSSSCFIGSSQYVFFGIAAIAFGIFLLLLAVYRRIGQGSSLNCSQVAVFSHFLVCEYEWMLFPFDQEGQYNGKLQQLEGIKCGDYKWFSLLCCQVPIHCRRVSLTQARDDDAISISLQRMTSLDVESTSVHCQIVLVLLDPSDKNRRIEQSGSPWALVAASFETHQSSVHSNLATTYISSVSATMERL